MCAAPQRGHLPFTPRSSAVGIGARVAAVAQQFTQGNISTTENQLDLAINGDGFFQVQRYDPDSTNTTINASGPILYSRNGQFKLDKDGYVVNNEGHHLLGQAPGSTNPSAPIKLGLSGGTATGADYSALGTSVNFAAGSATAATTARLGQTFGQSLLRLALEEFRTVNENQTTAT